MQDFPIETSQIRTDLLDIEVRQIGPADGAAMLLLHGWPDASRAWDRVAVRLAQAGYRCIAPSLRGFGRTRFHDPQMPRSGQIAALAQDAVDLLDAMKIARAHVVGHGWGARAAYVLGALFPDRVKSLVALSTAFETGIRRGDAIDPEIGQAYWYQWFFHTDRGREALEGDREKLCRYLWEIWSPNWKWNQGENEAEFLATAPAWKNSDWVAITLHSYRVRWGGAPRDWRYEALETRLMNNPSISASITVIRGTCDPTSFPGALDQHRSRFMGDYELIELEGVGHFPMREADAAVYDAIVKRVTT